MSDDLTKKGAADRSRISTSEEHELHYWSQKLGVSKEELKEAVHKAGNSVEAVRAHLGK
jgi:hypothetical protein